MKALRGDDAIEIFWQPRYKYEEGKAYIIDAQGEIESVVNIASVKYGASWRSAGIILVDDSLVEFCGLENFDFFVYALMRHSVNLIAGGWGETPEEVVGWFKGLGNLDFLLDIDYQISDPVLEPFLGLQQCKVEVETSSDGGRVGKVIVKEDKFLFDLEDREVLIPFLISVVPV